MILKSSKIRPVPATVSVPAIPEPQVPLRLTFSLYDEGVGSERGDYLFLNPSTLKLLHSKYPTVLKGLLKDD